MSELARHLETAVACARRGDLAAAAEACRQVLAIDPARPEAHYLLAMAAAERREPAVATAHLERYLAARPLDADAWYNLGVIRQQAGDGAGAAERYAAALERAPEHVAARINLANLRRAAGDVAEALALLEAGLAAVPSSVKLLLAWSRAALAADRAAEARDRLAQALADGVEDPALHDALAVALNRTGDRRAALEEARRAVAGAPERAACWHNLAAIASKLTEREDLLTGAAAAERALALAPDEAATWQCLGLIRSKLHDDGRAVAALARARELAPEEPRFAVDLGDHHLRCGRLEAGVAALEAAVALGDPRGEASRQLGVALLRAREPERALAALDRAEAAAPGDQRVIAHRAVALQALGRHAEADAYLGLDRHLRRLHLAPPPGFDDLAAFNAALAGDIAGHSRLRWEPIGLAARGGALTEELLADRTPAILGFEMRLREAIEALRTGLKPDPHDPFLRAVPGPDYTLSVWATLVHGGGHIDTHIHEESWLSGAYYVELPLAMGGDERDAAGWIEFGRPHAEIPCPGAARIERVQPEEGLLLLFPSYLFHRTLPCPGEGRRISISFDLTPR